MKKFEVGKSIDSEKFNKWFEYCTAHQIPYIIIENRSKYSIIKWDHINLDRDLDKVFSENSQEHREDLLNLFGKYANSKSRYTMTNLIFIVDNILLGDSQMMAEELYDIISNRINI